MQAERLHASGKRKKKQHGRGENTQIKVDLADPFQKTMPGGHENVSHLKEERTVMASADIANLQQRFMHISPCKPAPRLGL